MSSSGLYVKNGYLYKEGVGRIHKATDEEVSKYTSTPSTGSAADTTTPTASSGAATAVKPDNSIESYLAQNGVSPSLLSGGSGSSSSGSYKVTGVDRPARTGYLRSAKELGELYDINYDMEAIRGLYDDATNAKYALLSKELEQGENDFYTNNANANATLLDTLKKATSSAIATGASRGIAGAEQLGLMMEQQQAIAEEATNLAQERANMADEIAAEKAENIIKALEYSDSLKTTLGNLSSNIYSADTQYDVGLLDWAAQMKNVEALFEQIAAERDTNLAAQALQKELGLLEDERIRTEGAADREAQKYGIDKTLEGNKYAADKNYDASIYAANHSGGGGGGYGYTNDYIAELLKRLEAGNMTEDLGNRTTAITNLMNQGYTYETAQQTLDTDVGFLMSEKFGGTKNIPQGMTDKSFKDYLWNQGDMDTLAKVIAAQDKTAKPYADKLKDAKNQVKSDKELVKNNKAGGYNNRSDVKRFNNINTLLTKAKQEHTQNGTVSDATYNELKTVVNSLAFDYAWVSDAFNKKYNSSITNMQHNGSVTMNRLNSFVKNYMK